MISATAALPIVIIFEQHCDAASKQLLKELVPSLAGEGYDTYSYEAPQDRSEKEILAALEAKVDFQKNLHSSAQRYLANVNVNINNLWDRDYDDLVNLIRQYVSSQRYFHATENIRELPSSILLSEIFANTIKLCMTIKGIDIDFDEHMNMTRHGNPLDRCKAIAKNENQRISTFSQHLFAQYHEGKGIIFPCGASHAENLMNQLRKLKMEDQVLYYFPYSVKRHQELSKSNPEIANNQIFNHHKFCLSTSEDCKSLVKRILMDVKAKNIRYKREIITENSHHQFLKDFFQKDFKAFERPGHYVDVLLNVTSENKVEKIVEKLYTANIPSYFTFLQEIKYLVIPEVNTKLIADRIRLLK